MHRNVWRRYCAAVVGPLTGDNRQITWKVGLRIPAVAMGCVLLPWSGFGQTNSYLQTNLVSDGSVTAITTDSTLINPWGVAIGQQTPFWVNDAGTGLSAVYDGSGKKQFSVTVPTKAGGTSHGSPTGIAFNSYSSGFTLSNGSAATFLFVTLDGTISGWNASTTNALVAVDNSASGATYTGAALITGTQGPLLLVANFSKQKIDVYDSQFKAVTVPAGFSDTNLPSGFSPFGIHNVGGSIYVTYAELPSAPGPAVTGAGLGYVDRFDSAGTLQGRIATAGPLNAPWGVVSAPAGFGSLGGDLLVGNFGDGAISAFDPVTFALKGQLQDASGNTIKNTGLWELLFGTQATGDPNTLYLSAGINGERGGLFAAITPQAKVASGDFAISLPASTLSVQAGQSATANLTLSAMNGFNGAVSLACSGLPSGATCSFSPPQVKLAAVTASSTLTVTVASSGAGSGGSPYIANHSHFDLTLAAGLLAPMLLGFGYSSRKRPRSLFTLLSAALLLSGGLVALNGCSASHMSAGTPAQTNNYPVTITATSGVISHNSQIVVTIK